MKLGAVSYLNAEPLVWPIEKGDIETFHSVIRAYPSQLSAMLVNGEVDCALAPVVTLLDNPALVPVPDIAIACRGAVASVLVFHNGEFNNLEKIWLDPASRTSNVLVQILMDRESMTPCEFPLTTAAEMPAVENLPVNTGRLIIGDDALRLSARISGNIEITDLGELWREKTNHPFTFARWIARDGDIAAQVKDSLKSARDWSMLHMHEIIGPLAEQYRFSGDVVDRYLRTNITYMHGPREQAGEREFFNLAAKLNT